MLVNYSRCLRLASGQDALTPYYTRCHYELLCLPVSFPGTERTHYCKSVGEKSVSAKRGRCSIGRHVFLSPPPPPLNPLPAWGMGEFLRGHSQGLQSRSKLSPEQTSLLITLLLAFSVSADASQDRSPATSAV